MTSAVSLKNISCIFQTAGREVRAVDQINLDIRSGEFFTLLGPSGSGKTTCLRMIGGFTLPSSGTVSINGEDVSLKPPYARPVNTVFQDYALFPHMSILDNIAYPLMIQGQSKADRYRKATQLLNMVRLPDVAERKPMQLSGGQRQRVALARALVSEPKVLLLDEPLGALDLKLREQMQSELKQLQRQLGITFIFVTHDQQEALSMSDRIGVFNKGKIEQIATPTVLYQQPATRFVADFVGAANVLSLEQAASLGYGQAFMIRPECLQMGKHQTQQVTGVLTEKQFFGSFWRVKAAINNTSSSPSTASDVTNKLPLTLMADLSIAHTDNIPAQGQLIDLCWHADTMHHLAKHSENE